MYGSWRKFERRTSNKKEERFIAAVGYAAFSLANVESGTRVKNAKNDTYQAKTGSTQTQR